MAQRRIFARWRAALLMSLLALACASEPPARPAEGGGASTGMPAGASGNSSNAAGQGGATGGTTAGQGGSEVAGAAPNGGSAGAGTSGSAGAAGAAGGAGTGAAGGAGTGAAGGAGTASGAAGTGGAAGAPGALCANRTGGALIDLTIAGQPLRVWVTSQSFISEAERDEGRETLRHPLFDLRDGRDCDPAYSWHVDPATPRFTPEQMDICAAWPSDVEANKDYWLDVVYCPEAVHVVDVARR